MPLTTLTFALALALAAALLFNVQPMMGKMLLPLVGGAPSVWNVALAFFQSALLLGYLVAHLLTRLPPVWNGIAYLAILLLAATTLPIGLPAGWHPGAGEPVPLTLLGALIISVGSPFVALSLSAPTLQRLFANTSHPRARDPYFLYAASNFGSFTGLLAYPFWLEPHDTLAAQAVLWQKGFFGLIGLVGLALLLQWKNAASPVPDPTTSEASSSGITPPPLTYGTRVHWALLAFIPSSLTLGVTQYISTDIAASPLLWVTTLGLYLLTFVLAFSSGHATLKRALETTYPLLAALALSLSVFPLRASLEILVLHVLAFGATALACHSRLSALRPPPARLTEYFLWIAIGGALGGAFNAFLAPILFNQFAEYTLVLGLAFVVTRPSLPPAGQATVVALAAVALVRIGLDWLGIALSPLLGNLPYALLLTAITLGLTRVQRYPRVLLAGLTVTLTGFFMLSGGLFTGRDFFGVIRVEERILPGTTTPVRAVFHGTTIHGLQYVDPARRTETTGYYSNHSPISGVFAAYHPESVFIVGLGSGGMNCFAQPGQHFHFVEIDPLMVHVAQTWFSFLRDCPAPPNHHWRRPSGHDVRSGERGAL